MIKKNDIILVGLILVLGIGMLLYINFSKTEGSKVVVTVDGEVYDTFSLNKDITYTVDVKKGVTNTFEIKNGYVNMLDATCPDKLCVNHKDIHYNHETIVCLPNKVVLEIIDGEDSEVDMIAN